MSTSTPTDAEIPPSAGPDDDEYDASLNIDGPDDDYSDSDLDYFADRAADAYERWIFRD